MYFTGGIKEHQSLRFSHKISTHPRIDKRRFWLSAQNCRVPTPTSQNLEIEEQILMFGADYLIDCLED
jgi:hypothetical protein